MGSESIANEAEGQMGYWLRGQEGERNNNVFSKIRQVGKKKNIEKKYLALVKARQNLIQSPLFWLSKLVLFAKWAIT